MKFEVEKPYEVSWTNQDGIKQLKRPFRIVVGHRGHKKSITLGSEELKNMKSTGQKCTLIWEETTIMNKGKLITNTSDFLPFEPKRNIIIIDDTIENLVIQYKGKEYSVSTEKVLSLILEERKYK